MDRREFGGNGETGSEIAAAPDSGEALFPAAVCDVQAAVAYLRAHGAAWNLDPSFIAA